MLANLRKNYRSTCIFEVTPSANRDRAMIHVRTWIQSTGSPSNIVASVKPVNSDQFEVELLVFASSFSEADRKVDTYLNKLISAINDSEHEEFNRGSNLLTSA